MFVYCFGIGYMTINENGEHLFVAPESTSCSLVNVALRSEEDNVNNNGMLLI
jgi:hypothetical protein